MIALSLQVIVQKVFWYADFGWSSELHYAYLKRCCFIAKSECGDAITVWRFLVTIPTKIKNIESILCNRLNLLEVLTNVQLSCLA